MSQTVVHSFPPINHRQFPPKDRWESIDLLSGAVAYVCHKFHAYMSRNEMRDNIDARVIMQRAQDAVVMKKEVKPGELTDGLFEGIRVQRL